MIIFFRWSSLVIIRSAQPQNPLYIDTSIPSFPFNSPIERFKPTKHQKKKNPYPFLLQLTSYLVIELCGLSELADPQPILEEEVNKRVVTALYEALHTKDVETVHRLLAPDLEWWFHGPPVHQHLMRLLTGSSSPAHSAFTFDPLSIVAFGSTVLVEGLSEDWNVSWVHAWTVTDGIITQVREYFNTSVTVHRIGEGLSPSPSSSPALISSLESDITSSPSSTCQRIWQSKLSDNKSMPGLVLAL